MTILVVAAVMVDQGRVLTTQRPAGSHLAGMWEFPGGKVEPDEDPRDALARELNEELGIRADIRDVVEVTFHRYPNKNILLFFFRAFLRTDSLPPRAVGVADIAWRTEHQLDDALFPPADVAVLEHVRALLRSS